MLSIGAFSRLGHISIRMLRHYDSIGLLKPAYVDPDTGYRHYQWQQLETLAKIEMLKGYHFPLAQIVPLLSLDENALDIALHEKRIALYGELAEMQRALRRLDDQIGLMEDNDMNTQPSVIVMQAPEQTIFGIRRTINIGELHDLYVDVRGEMQTRGLAPAGAAILIYRGDEFSYEHMDVEAAFPIAGTHPDAHILPGGPHACAIHHGPYTTIRAAYDAIGMWLSEQSEYEIAGPGFERYIKDENDGIPPEAYETGVLFPLKTV